MKKRIAAFAVVSFIMSLCMPLTAYASSPKYTAEQQAVIDYLEMWSYPSENGTIRLAVDKIPVDILSEFFSAAPSEFDALIQSKITTFLSSFTPEPLEVNQNVLIQPYSTITVSNVNEAYIELIPFTSPLGGVFNGEVMALISMTLDYTWEGSGKLYINSISSPSIQIQKSGPVVIRSVNLTSARVSANGQQATVVYFAVLGYVADFIIFEDVTHTFSWTYSIF